MQLTQVAANARLRRLEALLFQQPDQLILLAHGRIPDDPEKCSAAEERMIDFGSHDSFLRGPVAKSAFA
jgi:hypothetical protein